MTQSTRPTKHEGYDRTGDWSTRTKITQELVHDIEDGLRYYEQDLWNDHEWTPTINPASSFKVLNFRSFRHGVLVLSIIFFLDCQPNIA